MHGENLLEWETIRKIALIFMIPSGVIAVPSIIMAGYGGMFLFQFVAEEMRAFAQHWKLILYLEAICDITFIISVVTLGIAEAKIKARNRAKAWEKEDMAKTEKKGIARLAISPLYEKKAKI